MSDEHPEALSERDEIEALLPWYVTGRLDPKERARVERYAEAHPEIRAHLALAREESDATIAANEAILAPSSQAFERLRTSIAAAARHQPASALLAQLSERFRDWIAGLAPPYFAFATVLAALLVIAQAAAIGALVIERTTKPAYHTASGGESTSKGTELLVGFSEKATIGEIDVLLKKLGAVVIDGPRAGLYRLRLPETGDEGRKAAIEALQHSDVVTIVLPGR
jgi:anti-sigma-K factor RskA